MTLVRLKSSTSSHVRSFCSTCLVLRFPPSKHGESSSQPVVGPRTDTPLGSASSSAAPRSYADTGTRADPNDRVRPDLKRVSRPTRNTEGGRGQTTAKERERANSHGHGNVHRSNTEGETNTSVHVRARKAAFLHGLGLGPKPTTTGPPSSTSVPPSITSSIERSTSMESEPRKRADVDVQSHEVRERFDMDRPNSKYITSYPTPAAMTDRQQGGRTRISKESFERPLQPQSGSGPADLLRSTSGIPSDRYAEASPVAFDNSKVHFIGIDLDTALTRIHTTKLAVYRSDLFNLRAFPSALLPARRPPPFPLEKIREYRRGRICVYTSVITSKSAVSKLAVERNRSRRRFKSALDQLINGSLDQGGLSRDQRMKLVSPEFAYVASLTAEAHDVDWSNLKSEILSALVYLRKRQPITWGEGARLPEPKYLRSTSEEGAKIGALTKQDKIGNVLL